MDLKELAAVFSSHSEKFKNDNIEMIKKFIDNNPGEKLPSYLQESFDLPEALSFMANEIQKLKDWNVWHMRNAHPYE